MNKKVLVGVFALAVAGSTVIAGGFGDSLGGSLMGSMVGGMITNASRSEPKTVVVHQPPAGQFSEQSGDRVSRLEERLASLEARVAELERAQ
jgi:hypothetical protein